MGSSFVKDQRCRMSDPANPHTLSRGAGLNPPSGCFTCNEQFIDQWQLDRHYHCSTCNVGFHDYCMVYPRKLRHPYHFQHPLTRVDITSLSDQEKPYELVFDKCDWCGGRDDPQKSFYRCSICGFCLDFSCARKSPPLTITYPKSHHHPLVFFPRPFSLPCDACGLVNSSEPVYTCSQCNYIVHGSCIDLPRVIKITRHPHRLFYTPYSPLETSICKICYKMVDMKYGQYTCYHEGCSYVTHSKCVTEENVWDGNELEWEPEETNESEDDIEPFKTMGVDVIKYFSHDHCLRLQKYDIVRDVDKQCEICIFPINSSDYYNCTQCDFFLHEVCANLPRKLDHALHRHPLVLQPSTQNDDKRCCLPCGRQFSGFWYKCSRSDCRDVNLLVDIRCILVPDYFTHKSHEHPIFITTTRNVIPCKGCGTTFSQQLHCTICEFVLCYRCATIPNEVYYKYDEHHLSLCYGEEVDDIYWCEICEKKVDPTTWFYTCSRCCITIHCDCILGSSVYMKSGFTFNDESNKVEVVCNRRSSTRPVCYRCKNRCPYSVYYKLQEKSLCSQRCCFYLARSAREKALSP